MLLETTDPQACGRGWQAGGRGSAVSGKSASDVTEGPQLCSSYFPSSPLYCVHATWRKRFILCLDQHSAEQECMYRTTTAWDECALGSTGAIGCNSTQSPLATPAQEMSLISHIIQVGAGGRQRAFFWTLLHNFKADYLPKIASDKLSHYFQEFSANHY